MNSHLACAMPYDTCVELKNLLGLGEKITNEIVFHRGKLGRRNSFGELYLIKTVSCSLKLHV